METETVSIKIPKAIVRFLREHEDLLGETTEEYLEKSIVGLVRADIESEDVFVPSAMALAKKYDLQEVFKKFDVEVWDSEA